MCSLTRCSRTELRLLLGTDFSCRVSPSLPPLWHGKNSYLVGFFSSFPPLWQGKNSYLGFFDTQCQPGAIWWGPPFLGCSPSALGHCRDIPDPLVAWKGQGSLRQLHGSLVGMHQERDGKIRTPHTQLHLWSSFTQQLSWSKELSEKGERFFLWILMISEVPSKPGCSLISLFHGSMIMQIHISTC